MSDHIYLKNKELRAKKGTKIFWKDFVPLRVAYGVVVDRIYRSDDSNRRFTKKTERSESIDF